jgi:aryl-alcohol dehydrogenase-like predicted oxidoreductase
MNFGPHTTEADAFALMDRAREHGINFFDTADVYGWKRGEGVTEQIIGRWFAQGDGRRESTVLATKLGNVMGDGPNNCGLSALHIRRSCEDSLRRLQTDHIDLYQLHRQDPRTPWEEIWQAMDRLIADGKVLYIGASNSNAWRLAQASGVAVGRGTLGFVSEQTMYNLFARSAEVEVLPACREFGIGLIPWSPLRSGMLGGVLDGQALGRRASERARQFVNEHGETLQRYEQLCRELGVRPADVALAWLLSNPAVTAPIIGPRTRQQLDESLHALEVRLTSESLQRLDAIFPPPWGTDPTKPPFGFLL